MLQDKAAMTQRWHAWEQEQEAIMQRQLQDQQLQASHTAPCLIGLQIPMTPFGTSVVGTPASALLRFCSCQQHIQ